MAWTGGSNCHEKQGVNFAFLPIYKVFSLESELTHDL